MVKIKQEQKSFIHNDIKYQRTDDTLLFRLKDSGNPKGMCVGIRIKKDGNAIKMTHLYNTNQEDAFIFMISKDTFDKYGVSNTIEMLKREGLNMNIFSGSFNAEIV